MRNLIGYSQFKKLYEEADPGVVADKERYFANVKGNFAGAETTLIGSGVIRLFNFFRRKGSQAILWSLFRPNLHKEYMKSLLRSIIRYEMSLPSPKTIYDATLIRDIEENKVEEQNFKVEIKIIDKGDGEFEQFKIGSEVLTEAGEKLQDGFYTISTKIIKIVDSKIEEIDYKFLDDDVKDEIEDVQEEKPEEVEIEKHISEFIESIKKKYDELDDKSSHMFTNQYVGKIQDIKRIFEDNIREIEEIKSNVDTPPVKLQRVLADLPVFRKTVEELNKLINYIQPKPSEEKAEEPKKVIEKPKKVAIGESLIIEEAEKLPKVGKDRKIGDELNLLSQVDIDLEDQEWLKQFDDPEVKKKITSVALESKSELVKLQLGAERFYIRGAGVDRKLENSWLKMVEGVKSKFTRFMNVDSVDPITLRKSIGRDEVDKLRADATGPIKQSNTIMTYDKTTKNNILKEALSLKMFSKQNMGSFGITSINNEDVIYCIDYTTIPHEKKKYPTYKIVANVDPKIFDEAEKNKDRTDFKEFISKEKLPELFSPKRDYINITGTGRFDYVYTFIISYSTDNLSTGNENTSGHIIFVYSKNKNIIDINESTINNFVFTFRGNDGKDYFLKNDAPTTDENPNSKISMSVSAPMHIDSTYMDNFGLIDNDRKPSLRLITKNPGVSGYTLGELKKYDKK